MEWTELIRLLKNARSVEELDGRREEIRELIPRVSIMFGFDQRHAAHPYDLWLHTLQTVVELPRDLPDDMLYLGALLHDIGKPATQCKAKDRDGKEIDDGNRYHPNHPAVGGRIVEEEILPELEKKGILFSEEGKKKLLYYVIHHDDTVGYDVEYVKEQKGYGAESLETFQNLMHLEVADALAHARIPAVIRRVEVCNALAHEEGERLWRIMEHKEVFHVHTYRCGHAEMIEDAEYVEKAYGAGAEDIWFSDHAPFPGDPFGHRMKMEQLEEYLDSMQKLKAKYQGRIRIHVGLEIEYFEAFEEYYQALKKERRLEFLLLGQHMGVVSPGKYSYDLPKEELDEKEAVYILQSVVQGMKTGYFDFCAHPDRAFRRRRKWTKDMEEMAREVIETAKECGVILEKNLSSMQVEYYYWPEFWKMVPPDVKTLIGYDAHGLSEM